MGTMKDTKYDRLERKLVETAQQMLDDFSINKEDLYDIIKDCCNESEEPYPVAKVVG